MAQGLVYWTTKLVTCKFFVYEHAFSSVICRYDTRKVQHHSDRDINWMSPVQGKSPPVQIKEPYGNLDMVLVRFHPATRSVQSTPADNTRKRVSI